MRHGRKAIVGTVVLLVLAAVIAALVWWLIGGMPTAAVRSPIKL